MPTDFGLLNLCHLLSFTNTYFSRNIVNSFIQQLLITMNSHLEFVNYNNGVSPKFIMAIYFFSHHTPRENRFFYIVIFCFSFSGKCQCCFCSPESILTTYRAFLKDSSFGKKTGCISWFIKVVT